MNVAPGRRHRGSSVAGLRIRTTVAVFIIAGMLAGGLEGQERRYRTALPGYRFEFPRDHFSHPDFKTEWWYYTGNLRAADGTTFGFELTFFREGIPNGYPNPSAWRIDNLYIAHFAVTGISGGTFHYAEKMHRGALGLAGAETPGTASNPGEARVWVGDWTARVSETRHVLEAATADYAVQLELRPKKPPMAHGRDGVSRKGPEWGAASHYYSFTRLEASGKLRFGAHSHEVTGLAWMDHEFSTSQLSAGQSGWDWLSLQFDDGSELMLYQIRRRDGTRDPYSAGTWVGPAGNVVALAPRDYSLQPAADSVWKSPRTGGAYPLRWTVKVPSLQLELDVQATVAAQELVTSETTGVTYWEGAVRAIGKKGDGTVMVRGYLEMTGYAPGRIGTLQRIAPGQ